MNPPLIAPAFPRIITDTSMALSEPERGAFEGKFGHEQEQMDFGTHDNE